VLGGEALVDRRRHGHSAFNWALMWSRWGSIAGQDTLPQPDVGRSTTTH